MRVSRWKTKFEIIFGGPPIVFKGGASPHSSTLSPAYLAAGQSTLQTSSSLAWDSTRHGLMAHAPAARALAAARRRVPSERDQSDGSARRLHAGACPSGGVQLLVVVCLGFLCDHFKVERCGGLPSRGCSPHRRRDPQLQEAASEPGRRVSRTHHVHDRPRLHEAR